MAVDVGMDVVQRADGTMRVRTNGMGRRGRPDIEVTSVLPHQVEFARDLLGRVATALTSRPLFTRQPVEVADLSLELTEGETMQPGMFGRAFGADRTVLRVTDVGSATADRSICAVAREQARRLRKEGRSDEAARRLTDALRAAETNDADVTAERALAWTELSYVERDSRRAQERLLMGLQLSEASQRSELQATFDELRRCDPTSLQHDMERIIGVNLDRVADVSTAGQMLRVVPSPIWLRADDGRAELAMTLVPAPYLDLYWSGATRSALLSGSMARLAVRIFSAGLDTDEGIARLAFNVRDSVEAFSAGRRNDRMVATPDAVAPHLFLASALLAHIARLFTAGLSDLEIEAVFGLVHDPAIVCSAAGKVQQFDRHIATWSETSARA